MNLSTASDDEQAELLKKWVRENGLSMILGLVVGGSAIFGWNYYNNYQTQQNISSSVNFKDLQKLDNKAYLKANKKFTEDNIGSIYAVNANLIKAAKAVEEKDYASARTSLEWVMANAKESGHKLLARLNLARLNINDKKYDAAIALLENTNSQSFSSQYQITLGDAYAQKGQNTQAKNHYTKAKLSALDNPENLNALNMKINNLKEAQ